MNLKATKMYPIELCPCHGGFPGACHGGFAGPCGSLGGCLGTGTAGLVIGTTFLAQGSEGLPVAVGGRHGGAE